MPVFHPSTVLPALQKFIPHEFQVTCRHKRAHSSKGVNCKAAVCLGMSVCLVYEYEGRVCVCSFRA